MQADHRRGRSTRRRALAIVTPIAALAAGLLTTTPVSALAATAPTTTASPFHYSCGDTFSPGKIHCLVIKDTSAHPTAQNVRPDAIPSGNGYGPSQFQAAYGLTAASAADGAGETVAVVDAYNDPSAASDLAAYRSAAGLPALTSGQLGALSSDQFSVFTSADLAALSSAGNDEGSPMKLSDCAANTRSV